MIRGGWTITGSWPIATEMGSRLRARESAALATSVHLVCRPRPDDAPVGDWADVLHELPLRVGEWMERLHEEGIRGADLVFACIGPALEIFSRYSAAETPDGTEVGLPVYLERVWEVVGRTALEAVLGAGEAKVRNGQAAHWRRMPASRRCSSGPCRARRLPRGTVRRKPVTRKAAAGARRLPSRSTWRAGSPSPWGPTSTPGRTGSSERTRGRCGCCRCSNADDSSSARTGPARRRNGSRRVPPPAPSSSTSFPKRRPDRGAGDGAELRAIDATTLDRVHAAMLLQASGHANALGTLIATERERGPDFLRLANSLSVLYPRGSEKKRLLDAMLLAVPR